MSRKNHSIVSLENVSLSYSLKNNFLAQQNPKITPLRNINLEVYPGEVLGIIGRNGCGKSTLLKLIAGIFKPCSGNIRINKNIEITLLSLGVGMESNLTGEENAILNGILFGKSRNYMSRCLYKIKEFSGLGEFFHYPINTYSTGMIARLGFSVAMVLDPDIYLLDEILGVGDSNFYEKSSRALAEKISEKTRTAILVSHSSGTIRCMCNRAAWIENGRILKQGNVNEVTEEYEKYMLQQLG